jgi:hypothetical protein
MLPFEGGKDHRTKLIQEAKESCETARRLINIHAALSICVLSLCREREFPEFLLESVQDEDVQTLAVQIAGLELKEPEDDESEAYSPRRFAAPTPERLWPYFIPAALLELEGSGYNGYIPEDCSPTGQVMSVFTTAYDGLPNGFIEKQIETADILIEALNPLTEAMAGYVDTRLNLKYEGLSLWPFADSVIRARINKEDFSKPAGEWFRKYWPDALAREDRLDKDADVMAQTAPVPSRVLH